MRTIDVTAQDRVLAVDPGTVTGLAEYACDTQVFVCAHLPALQAVDYVNDALYVGDVRLVVVESFTITAGTLQKSRAGSNDALEVIGAVRWLCRAHRVPFELQQPAEARGFSTDRKLVAAGFETPTRPDHERSAARHLLLALARHKLINVATLVRPS